MINKRVKVYLNNADVVIPVGYFNTMRQSLLGILNELGVFKESLAEELSHIDTADRELIHCHIETIDAMALHAHSVCNMFDSSN